MRRPLIVTVMATITLLSVFVVPTAFAQGPGDKPCTNSKGRNANCYPVATVSGSPVYSFQPCKDGTAPPCAKNKSFTTSTGSAAIPTGAAFLIGGALVLSYLGYQRRRTLKLHR